MITKTRNILNRTPETRARYDAHINGTHIIPDDPDELIADFVHWKIIKNKFPYDAIFSTHHMIVSKRIFSSLEEATEAEYTEYLTIKKKLDADGFYDLLLENFHKNQSKPKHCHIHILVWKVVESDLG